MESKWYSPFPEFQSTERPDKVASSIMEGRVAIVVDNSPEAIPTDLLLAISAARAVVTFPVVVEVLIMELEFELLREAGIRLPGQMGNTIGVVYGVIFIFISKMFKNGFVNQLFNSTNDIVVTIILAIYVGRFIVRAGLITNLFYLLVTNTMLKGYGIFAIVIPFVLVCGYGGLRNMEGRGRLVELLFWVVMVPIFILFIFAIKHVNLSYVAPDFDITFGGVIEGEYILMLLGLPLEFLLFSIPYVRWRKHTLKSAVVAVIIGVVLNVFMYIVTVGILGVKETGDNVLCCNSYSDYGMDNGYIKWSADPICKVWHVF